MQLKQSDYTSEILLYVIGLLMYIPKHKKMVYFPFPIEILRKMYIYVIFWH